MQSWINVKSNDYRIKGFANQNPIYNGFNTGQCYVG
jgi:hypothetical protein